MFRNLVAAASRRTSAVALAMVTMLAAPVAFAQDPAAVTFDPADVLAIVASAQAFIIAIGMAVLTLFMVAKGIRWARRAG